MLSWKGQQSCLLANTQLTSPRSRERLRILIPFTSSSSLLDEDRCSLFRMREVRPAAEDQRDPFVLAPGWCPEQAHDREHAVVTREGTAGEQHPELRLATAK